MRAEMGHNRQFLALLMTGVFSLAPVSIAGAAPATDPFSWTLTNRFRLLSEADEARFGKDYAKYQVKAAQGEYGVDFTRYQLNYARLTERPYASRWNPVTAQYDLDGYVQSDRRSARLTYARGAHCAWTVNGAPIKGSQCKGALATLHVGANQATVSVDGAHAIDVGPINVQDYFAVVIGDSTASGEGNPEVMVSKVWRQEQGSGIRQLVTVPAKWLDERCHRSMISAPLLAL